MFFKINWIFFFFFILQKTSSVCIQEWQQCSNGGTANVNFGVCCSPLSCVMTSYNYGQCQFVQTGTNCAARYGGCSKTSDCCPNMSCVAQSSSYSSCQVTISDPTTVVACVSDRGQCGGFNGILGQTWDGTTKCCSGTCTPISIYYSQCLSSA